MKKEKWNEDWMFWEDKDSFALVWDVPKQARKVTLPHDAMIEKAANPASPNQGNTGFRDGGNYTYVKNLFVPTDKKGKTFLLACEGIYMNALVYVNGQLAGKNLQGYTTFFVPLNPYLQYGKENEIRIQARNANMSNSRWYSGSGIYRDIYLLEGEAVYLIEQGVQITCEAAEESYAVLKVNSEIKNRKSIPARITLKTTIQDAEGKIVGWEESKAVLGEQEQRTLSQRIVVENPSLWSDTNPALYTAVSTLVTEDGESDTQQNEFGIRTLSLDAKRGLRVNGKSVKLRGACVHHDNGLLGAATYEDFHVRQIKILKESGFNAVRMSHHPMAPVMLRACDQLGMYVMDEFSDMWTRCKSDLDYGLSFGEWWENDVTAMVRKDYNHPSVILYSVGNEIPEIGTDLGAKVCHNLNQKIKELDQTRYTLAGINGVFAAGDRMGEILADLSKTLQERGEISGNVNDFMTVMDSHMDDIVVHPAISQRLEMACASLDIAGYNYMTARYESDGKAYPNRVIVGSETYPPEIARNWEVIKRCPHVIGDFTWTGWDYIGEAGVGVPAYRFGEGGFGAQFPAQLAYCGDIDITGFRRPASYYRECVFGLRKAPYIAVQNPRHYGETLIKTPWVISDAISSWTWRGCEGKPVVVEVYAAGEEVELLVNQVSVGKKRSGADAGYRTLFETTYQCGTVTAVVYEGGKEIARTDLTTASEHVHLALHTEEATGEELLFVNLALQDENGVTMTDMDCEVNVKVSGAATLVGLGSGDPKPIHNYNENVTKMWNGRAQMVLRKGMADGAVQIEVTDKEHDLQAQLTIE